MKKFFLLLLSLLFFGFSPDLFAQDISSRKALYYEKLPGQRVQCKLCPRECVLDVGQYGTCGVRFNQNGELKTTAYGYICALNIDPVEKKPLFHFLPGSPTFSIAIAGCNVRCVFCQNWQISMAKPSEVQSVYLTPQELIQKAKESKCPSISYTYSEPVVFYEYVLECAKLAHKSGLKNILVTSGYINPEPLKELCPYLDGIHLDLKGFSDKYYLLIAGVKLAPVLETIKILKQYKVHTELVNLVIPTLNDSPDEIKKMCLWIKENVGPDTPLHFSRFFPNYKLTNISPTPVETLEMARKIALASGLHYVYIGNVFGHEAENTYCPKCQRLLIRRVGYTVEENNIKDGRCKYCGYKIPGVWK